MSYQALLFYRDEKTARVLMQVLDELDFSVEPESEPFAAVKTLLAQRFDLLLVDCEDEQNGTLLFKSARNSDFNSDAVAVAVTTGQAAIAHAFRAGASLVLTKPISVEQAKSTLRLARGALRKAEAQRPGEPQKPAVPLSLPISLAQAATAHAAADFEMAAPPVAAPVFKSVVIPVPVEPSVEPEVASAAAAVAEESDDPAVHAGLAAVAAPDSQDQPAAASGARLSSRQARAWTPKEEESAIQLSPKPGATIAPVPIPNDAPAAQPEAIKPATEPAAAPAAASKDSAAKPPAGKAAPVPESAIPGSTLRFASLGIKEEVEDFDPAKSRKNFFIAALLVLVLAGGGYYVWVRFHPAISLPFLNKTAAPSAAHPAPAAAVSPQSSAAVQPSSDANPGNSVPGSPDSAATTSGATTAPVASPAANPPSTATAPPDTATPPAAVSSAPSGQTLAPAVLSEDVSQALLTTKVQPIYPEAAKHAHLEGSVRLQVNISASGDVNSVKLLSGNAVLATSAIAAVRQWKYQVYYVNGHPVAIQTQATLNFKLP